MNGTVDMKTVLEAAANSPDPTVRGIAIRRMEIEQECARLDAFFGFYAEARTAVPPAPARAVPAKAGGDKGGGKLIVAVREVLLRYGRPMPLATLFEAVRRDFPDSGPPKQESFRVRLSEHRDKIARTDAGYWPADVPVVGVDATTG